MIYLIETRRLQSTQKNFRVRRNPFENTRLPKKLYSDDFWNGETFRDFECDEFVEAVYKAIKTLEETEKKGEVKSAKQ